MGSVVPGGSFPPQAVRKLCTSQRKEVWVPRLLDLVRTQVKPSTARSGITIGIGCRTGRRDIPCRTTTAQMEVVCVCVHEERVPRRSARNTGGTNDGRAQRARARVANGLKRHGRPYD